VQSLAYWGELVSLDDLFYCSDWKTSQISARGHSQSGSGLWHGEAEATDWNRHGGVGVYLSAEEGHWEAIGEFELVDGGHGDQVEKETAEGTVSVQFKFIILYYYHLY